MTNPKPVTRTVAIGSLAAAPWRGLRFDGKRFHGLIPLEQHRLNALEDSIRAYGVTEPFPCFQRDKQLHIAAGHHTLQAAINCGVTEVPIELYDWSDDEARRYMHVENDSSYDASMSSRCVSVAAELQAIADGAGLKHSALHKDMLTKDKRIAPWASMHSESGEVRKAFKALVPEEGPASTDPVFYTAETIGERTLIHTETIRHCLRLLSAQERGIFDLSLIAGLSRQNADSVRRLSAKLVKLMTTGKGKGRKVPKLSRVTPRVRYAVEKFDEVWSDHGKKENKLVVAIKRSGGVLERVPGIIALAEALAEGKGMKQVKQNVPLVVVKLGDTVPAESDTDKEREPDAIAEEVSKLTVTAEEALAAIVRMAIDHDIEPAAIEAAIADAIAAEEASDEEA
jgi:hypothetical protein